MHDLDLTLTGGLAAALVLGYVTHRLGLSPLVGYLLAGVAVGPTTPGFVADRHVAEQLAHVGVVLLMFGVGLHFHVGELLAVRRVAVPGATGQSLVATALGCGVGLAAGWGWSAGVVFGLSISVASTVVLLRVLSDNNALHTPSGHIAVGWLVVEDLFTVVVLVVLPVAFRPGAGGAGAAGLALAWAAVKIGLLVAFVIFGGGRLIPWLLARVAATHSRELFTLTVLVLALGIAVGAAELFTVSMELGAFLAGMVVGRSEFSARAAAEALPMRDAFAVLFFVAVGMLFDPAHLLAAPGLLAATLGVVLLGKPVAALAIVLALRHPLRVALAVAVALAQVGEFSFLLANLGRGLGILSDRANDVIVAAAIVSISLNPILYRLVDPLDRLARRSPALPRWLTGRPRAVPPGGPPTGPPPEAAAHGRAIVVGYGPVGRTLVRLLQENDIGATVVELNLDTVRRLRRHGLRAVYGDATHKATAVEAGAERAAVLILSTAGMHGSEEAVRVAREVNPRIRVFARANYLREVPALRRAGADAVFAGEGEVALAMTEYVLRRLGAGGEQIDRERERIRTELFGPPLAVEALAPPPRPPAGGGAVAGSSAQAAGDGPLPGPDRAGP
jgi:CPA2 family monovalent cation:H+ antiporter-2